MQCIGIMTGNSLDAADLVLTDFVKDTIRDIRAFTRPYPPELSERIRQLRRLVRETGSDMKVLRVNADFLAAINQYTVFIAETVIQFISVNKLSTAQIRAIGFHGQTLDHFPPSVAGTEQPYTLQIGNAQLLADLTNIPVVFDFRSDDIFSGGEGAPLAPMHNRHLADSLFPGQNGTVAFCNAGNTANIALINNDTDKVLGWDAGPFNHFPDMLARRFWNANCDYNGTIGKTGKIRKEIVEQFYLFSAADKQQNNFYELPPPKSSDPQWYQLPSSLPGEYNLKDVLRSAEYFSAYNLALSLRFVPKDMPLPERILLFGGGWHNPLSLADFKMILQEKTLPVVLDSHQKIFSDIFARCKTAPQIDFSDAFGISGQYMEARIFADLARCYFEKIPFCYPKITGCRQPTVCGICCRPGDNDKHLWSRAAKGW